MLEQKFKELKEKKEGALIGYMTLGAPDIETSKKLVRALAENVDILELGIPFSDPIADGPTIRVAMETALKAGMNTDIAFEIVEEMRKQNIATPFIFMTYYNIVLQYGEERFVKKCSEAGVEGILICDLPVEEAHSILNYCDKYGVEFIFLIAPTTTEKRLEEILHHGRGPVYLVSVLGVTGVRKEIEEMTCKKIQMVKRKTSRPLIVGFGISKRQHVKALIEAGADGVVVGSAFVDVVVHKGGSAEEELKELAKELKEGTMLD